MRVYKKMYVVFLDPVGRRCGRQEAVLPNESTKGKLRPGYRRELRKSRRYYGNVTGSNSPGKPRPLSVYKQVSQQMLAKIIAEKDRERHTGRDRKTLRAPRNSSELKGRNWWKMHSGRASRRKPCW